MAPSSVTFRQLMMAPSSVTFQNGELILKKGTPTPQHPVVEAAIYLARQQYVVRDTTFKNGWVKFQRNYGPQIRRVWAYLKFNL